jgi:DNA-directed RNA polymerase specialized sigma subunit
VHFDDDRDKDMISQAKHESEMLSLSAANEHTQLQQQLNALQQREQYVRSVTSI